MKLKVTDAGTVVGLYAMSSTELSVYMRSRPLCERSREYTSFARDGATITLLRRSNQFCKQFWMYVVKRDGLIVHLYDEDRWAETCQLFMILLELVPRDQEEVVCAV